MSSLCNDQTSFNEAVKKAVKNLDEDQQNQCKTVRCQTTVVILTLLMLILYMYAIILAMKIEDKSHRIIQLVFALTTGPLYIIAYFLAGF
jgi:hypothetical protein